MPVEQLKKIADEADMIVAGYAFTKNAEGLIQVLNLSDPEEACVLQKDGTMIETVVQRQGVVSESDMKKIRKYIKLNHETMFEVWSQNSEHGYYGENK